MSQESAESVAGYAQIDHTADVGVSAWGPTPASAFAEVALGMFAIMLDADPTTWQGAGEPAEHRVRVSGSGWPLLLVNWLSELLFLFEVERFVPRTICLTECAPPHCAATLIGTRLASMDEAAGTSVKAVTYHRLAVDVSPEGAEIRVILDI